MRMVRMKELLTLYPHAIAAKQNCFLIEEKHPGYLRELFCYAQQTKSAKATFKELADQMNLKSEAEGETRATLSLHMLQLNRWFQEQGGKEKSSKKKPLDTPDHMEKRLQWVREHWDLLTNPDMPVTYLDEKWFYVTNGRRKIKRLPLGDGVTGYGLRAIAEDEESSIPRQGNVHGSGCKTTTR